MPTCECIAGNDDTYILTCEDGCDSCDANQTCGFRSFTQVIDSQGSTAEYRDCFEFTTSSFEGDVICYETTDDDRAAPASQQKKFSLRNDRNHPSTPAFFHDRSERMALHHKKVDQERLESQCRISVNGVNCTSCEDRFTECGLKGERSYLYADCTNNEIDSIVDECRNEGFDGILLPFFTAYYRGTCKNGTVEPGDSTAAMLCNDLATENELLSSDFKTTCECIPIDQGGTYTLSCEDNCQSCDEGEDCGTHSYTELVDPNGLGFEAMSCFEHAQGDFEGDKVCFGSVFTANEERCIISVNDNECKSCEYVSQSCGILGDYSGLHADCTNVVEINGMVDECHNEGFESGGVLLPLFTSFDVGMCSSDGNATGDPTDPSEPLAEELCKAMMEYFSESELKTTCESIAGADNTTYTLSCQDWCEICDPELNICGIRSFTELIVAQGGDYAYGECFEYTQGSFEGTKICTEFSDSNGMKTCHISANGVDCSLCEYQDKMCGKQGYQGQFFTANCNNVVDIGVIVDECTGAGLGDDEILAAYYYAYDVGSCNITEPIEVTDQPTEPPETGEETDQRTQPAEAGVTSGAKRDSQMVVSSIVVPALLFSSLA